LKENIYHDVAKDSKEKNINPAHHEDHEEHEGVRTKTLKAFYHEVSEEHEVRIGHR